MPNWCSGVLKVRGTKENILNFLQNGIEAVNIFGGNAGKHTVEFDKYGDIEIKDVKGLLHIKNTRRNFIDKISHDLCLREYSDDTFVLAIDDFKAAWWIDAKPLAEISKKYGVDFKIYAFEMGIEFNQDIEIVAGEIVKDDEVKFNNYIWECINPFIGG